MPNDPEQAQQLFGPQLRLNHPVETVNFFVDYQLAQQDDGTNRFYEYPVTGNPDDKHHDRLHSGQTRADADVECG